VSSANEEIENTHTERSTGALGQEARYHRKLVDELSGEVLRQDLTLSALKHELKQKRQAMALLHELQRALGDQREFASIMERAIQLINTVLGMDRTIAFVPSGTKLVFRPSAWAGLSATALGNIKTIHLHVGEELCKRGGQVLANDTSPRASYVEEIRQVFELPYFVAVPVIVDSEPVGLLVSGRCVVAKPLNPPLDQGDIDTLQSIADLIQLVVENVRFAVFREMDRFKSDFFANVSHEFRTPIALTLGPVEQMLNGQQGELSAEIRSQLRMMGRNQERLLRLVNQILDLAKIESGKMELRAGRIVDMNAFIEERVRLFRTVAKQRGITVTARFGSEVAGAELYVDPGKIDTLLLNLLSNALKFTAKGRVEVVTAIIDGAFHISVLDTGAGIGAEHLPYVFDRFRQISGGESSGHVGTGIGLALVQEIAQLHGGTVTVQSEYGKGSRFDVAIPLGAGHLNRISVTSGDESSSRESSMKIEETLSAAAVTTVAAVNREADSAFDASKPTVLYVEDNADLRTYVGNLLRAHYNTFVADSGQSGLAEARKRKPEVIVTDEIMSPMSGGEMLKEIRSDPALSRVLVVFLTARAAREARLETLTGGADDYLSKPFDHEELLLRIGNLLSAREQERELRRRTNELETANELLDKEVNDRLRAEIALREANEKLEERIVERTADLRKALDEVDELKRRLQAENVYLRDEIKLVHNFDNIVGRSQGIRRMLEAVEQVADTDATVLILGETGTGKELVARALHSSSLRKDKPLIKVDCASLTPTLIESELFGHEKGSFTGADRPRPGRFELAEGGTIFLDEIGELPLDLQVKLLRVLQDGEFERLGSSETSCVDVRVLAATNRDLRVAVSDGRFREDLYYRLNVFPVTCPALREREGDIPILVRHFVATSSVRIGREISEIPSSVISSLQRYHWPGNVRELANIIERAVIISRGSILQLPEFSGAPTGPRAESSEGAKKTLAEMERQHIERVLQTSGWRVRGIGGAAEILGMKPTTLDDRIRKHRIIRPSDK
jgi:formate hydrogenlyase transcriptional activator